MGDQAERVVLEAEDNVTPITNKANSALDAFERKAAASGDKLVRINDQTRNSVQRLITSLEKQADLYGKSGVEKLIVQRDQLLQRYQREPAAIDAITRSYQKMIEAETKAAQAAAEVERKRAEAQAASQRAAAGQAAMGAISNPMEAMRSGGMGLLTGVGAAGGAIAGVAVGLGAVTMAGWKAAESLGAYGLEIENARLRTGLTTKEVGQFSFAARLAGQDVTIFERLMRGLSQALGDENKEGEKARETMAKMGVDVRGLSGEMKPTGDLLLEIAGGLSKLPAGYQRDAAAMDLFKRAGIEAIPVLTGLVENVKRAKELGLGATDEDLKRWEEYHRNITEAEALWDRFTRKIKEPLAATVVVLMKWGGWASGGSGSKRPHVGEMLVEGGSNPTAVSEAWGDILPPDTFRNLYTRGIPRGLDIYAQQQGQIRAGTDAQIRAYQGRDIEAQLKTAEGALAKLPKPEMGVSTLAQLTDYKTAEQKVESIKGQIESTKKASEELKAFRREAAEFEKKGDDGELDAIGKIWQMRDQLLQQAAKVKASEAEIAGIRKAADAQATAITQKNQAAFDKYDAQRRGDFFASPLMLQVAGVSTKEDLAEQKRQAAEMQRGQDRVLNIGVDAQREVLQRRATAEAKQAATPEEAYQIRVDLAAQLAQIEVDRIQKEDNAANRMVLAAQAQKTLQEDLAHAQDDLEAKRTAADEAHQQAIEAEVDAIAKVSGGLFHTLLTKPQEFPSQLRDHVRDAFLKPVTEGLGHITGNILQPVTSQIGSAFKTVFGGGGKDDVNVSTDKNTAATEQNSAKLATLTALLASLAGVAAPSVSLPALAGGAMPSISLAAPARIAPSLSSIVSMGGFAAPGGMAAPDLFNLPQRSALENPMYTAIEGGAPNLFNLPVRSALGNPMYTALGGMARPGGTGSFSPTNLRGSLGNLENFAINPSIWNATGTSFGAYAGSVLTSPAATTAGMMLGTSGLTGSRMGTLGGIGMGTVGGALTGAGIGAQFGGPAGALLGAGIGAVAGFGIGLGEKLAGIESPQQKAHDDIKSIYGVDIPQNSGTIKQVVSIAQSQFGGDVAVAVRSPSVRQMVMLYSEATGQHMPLSGTTPYAGILAEQGGKLYQQASYQDGQAHTYASSLPTLGGITGTPYTTAPAPNTAAGTGVPSIALNINGTPITADFVADQSMAAQQASYGRTQMSANMQVPGLMVG